MSKPMNEATRFRLLAAATAEPDLSVSALAERFGVSRNAAYDVLNQAGLRGEHKQQTEKARAARAANRAASR
jgi:transposase-like protein